MADRPSLDAWLAEQLPAVVARAQEGALADAEALLRRRFAQALIAAVDEPRRTGAGSERTADHPLREPAPQAAAPRQERLLWLYGVQPADQAVPEAPGVEGSAIDVVHEAGLTALVSEVPAADFSADVLERRLEDLEVVERLARAHEGVLEATLQSGDVLPFRMCTLYQSADAVRRFLSDESPELHATLERLAGKAEWGVKGFLDLVAAVPANAAVESASGTEYLARRRAARDDAEHVRIAAEHAVASVHAQLAERASAAQLGRPQDRRLTGRDEEMVLNAAYLVPRGGTDAFARRVDQLREQHAADGLTLELTGPWPPYHFVGQESG